MYSDNDDLMEQLRYTSSLLGLVSVVRLILGQQCTAHEHKYMQTLILVLHNAV